jgi:hypothetical protein
VGAAAMMPTLASASQTAFFMIFPPDHKATAHRWRAGWHVLQTAASVTGFSARERAPWPEGRLSVDLDGSEAQSAPMT